jgi:multiple sugar transport system substrate-binding protein
VASGPGIYDLYYLDESWMAFFSGNVVDPVSGVSMYNDIIVGVPYDIPVFIQMYCRNIFDELSPKPAITMTAFLLNAQAIQKAKGPDLYWTTGMTKSGHYSLECDWMAWLCGQGGSIFGPDSKFTSNDE